MNLLAKLLTSSHCQQPETYDCIFFFFLIACLISQSVTENSRIPVDSYKKVMSKLMTRSLSPFSVQTTQGYWCNTANVRFIYLCPRPSSASLIISPPRKHNSNAPCDASAMMTCGNTLSLLLQEWSLLKAAHRFKLIRSHNMHRQFCKWTENFGSNKTVKHGCWSKILKSPKEQKLKRNQACWRRLKPQQTQQWKELNWLFVSAHWYLFCPASGLGFRLIEFPWLFFFYPAKMFFFFFFFFQQILSSFLPLTVSFLVLFPSCMALPSVSPSLTCLAAMFHRLIVSCLVKATLHSTSQLLFEILSGKHFLELTTCLPWPKLLYILFE